MKVVVRVDFKNGLNAYDGRFPPRQRQFERDFLPRKGERIILPVAGLKSASNWFFVKEIDHDFRDQKPAIVIIDERTCKWEDDDQNDIAKAFRDDPLWEKA